MNFKADVERYLGVILDDYQLKQFNDYFNFLIDYNKRVNLTAITTEIEVYYKHFFDSLTSIRLVDFKKIITICDMGAGAGFPSIPLKIVFPHLEIFIVDALNKRITFLRELVRLLNINKCYLSHERIENFAKNNQNTFDLVTARALGNMSLITEMGIPMVKLSGIFLAYKGPEYVDELESAKNGICLLGGEIDKVESFILPDSYGTRNLISIRKKKEIKGYPRVFQVMKNKPL